MNILVTGGTGFIGRALIHQLLGQHKVYCLTRRAEHVRRFFDQSVTPVEEYSQLAGVDIDAVVNLAGAGIADQRWTESRKALLRDSRIDGTRLLVEWMSRQTHPPRVLLSGSAIGYYGDHPEDAELSEDGTVTQGFTHQLCADWEAEALRAVPLGVRVCLLRTGVVLGKGGALGRMLPPFRLGLGGPISDGTQWMSWIHLEDQVAAILYLLSNRDAQGAFNLTAPESVSNQAFSKCLARTLKRPAFFTVPAVVIRLMLGEGAELLLGGQRVAPVKLQELGFSFQYPQLSSALDNIL